MVAQVANGYSIRCEPEPYVQLGHRPVHTPGLGLALHDLCNGKLRLNRAVTVYEVTAPRVNKVESLIGW